jgi:hypothetical protein
MVPADFQGKVDMWIGRPARPGEQYQVAGSAFNRGEPLYGLTDQILGHPLSKVLPLLAQHHVTVARCLIDSTDTEASGTCDPSRMPGNWYVHDVPVYGGNQVIAIIGRDKPAPGGR